MPLLVLYTTYTPRPCRRRGVQTDIRAPERETRGLLVEIEGWIAATAQSEALTKSPFSAALPDEEGAPCQA